MPFSLGRFLVLQGVREVLREVGKNDAHREEAKNSGFPVRCRTSWGIFVKGPGRGAAALPCAGFLRSIYGSAIRFRSWFYFPPRRHRVGGAERQVVA